MFMYADYTESISNDSVAEIEKSVNEYNDKLFINNFRFETEKTNPEYPELLNIQNGIMGYITVNSAGIKKVPIYHYTTTDALQAGAGHMVGSSLPSDSMGVHCVISGHTGMSGMKMFSQLENVTYGDTFDIKYLNKILTYKVDKIKVVLPDDISDIEIDGYNNYCSLITCTPLGVNSHRLIVRGYLFNVENVETEKLSVADIVRPSGLKDRFATYELVMTGISIPLLMLGITGILNKNKKNNNINKKTKINKTVYRERRKLMTKIFKKVFAIVIMALLIFSVASITSFAANEKNSYNIGFSSTIEEESITVPVKNSIIKIYKVPEKEKPSQNHIKEDYFLLSLKTNDKGKALTRLPVGEYVVTEDNFKVSDKEYESEIIFLSVTDHDAGFEVYFKHKAAPKPILDVPFTGQTMIVTFAAIGAIIISLGVIIILTKKKKNAKTKKINFN